jgi:hypothetical protein
VVVVVAVVSLAAMRPAAAGDLIYGCCSRPACGKICKLVCETKKITAVGYGCECETICIPGRSQQGCKHCETRCCCDSDVKGCEPKIEFCWYDWFPCGCGKPRTVRVLTKYEAEKEVCWYHWEVVDGCNGCCPGPCHCVYKAAPPEADVGDVIEVTPEEQAQLASYVSADGQSGAAASGALMIPTMAPVSEPANANRAVTQAAAEAPQPSAWQKWAMFWRDSDEQK